MTLRSSIAVRCKTLVAVLAVLSFANTGPAQTTASDPLKSGFENPPNSARPRVWWHWMNGNITREGIQLDLEWMHRVGLGGFQNFEKMLRDELLDLTRVGELLAIRALADAFENLADCIHADIGRDQRILQFVKKHGVDFFASSDGVFQPIQQAGTRLLDAGFQAIQQVGFLFYGAK